MRDKTVLGQVQVYIKGVQSDLDQTVDDRLIHTQFKDRSPRSNLTMNKIDGTYVRWAGRKENAS